MQGIQTPPRSNPSNPPSLPPQAQPPRVNRENQDCLWHPEVPPPGVRSPAKSEPVRRGPALGAGCLSASPPDGLMHFPGHGYTFSDDSLYRTYMLGGDHDNLDLEDIRL